MILRTVPELSFILDDSMEYSDKINKILGEIKKSETENQP
jgi:ribosome-binding factor A